MFDFVSYKAMGMEFAAVPKSTLEALRALDILTRASKQAAHNRTHIIWAGEPSPSLRRLLSILRQKKQDHMRWTGSYVSPLSHIVSLSTDHTTAILYRSN